MDEEHIQQNLSCIQNRTILELLEQEGCSRGTEEGTVVFLKIHSCFEG